MWCAGWAPVVEKRRPNSAACFGQLALVDGGTNGACDGEGGVADLVTLQETTSGLGGHGGAGTARASVAGAGCESSRRAGIGTAQQGIHPGFGLGESPVLLLQVLGFVHELLRSLFALLDLAFELFHPQVVLHLVLLVAGIASPVE
jgi:hypothetical protein